jgi:hypothetical protein
MSIHVLPLPMIHCPERLTLKRTASRPAAALQLMQNRNRAAMRWRDGLAVNAFGAFILHFFVPGVILGVSLQLRFLPNLESE